VSAEAFQEKAHECLADIFGADAVSREFSIDTGATDVFNCNAGYLPRLDLAMGPFNLTPERDKNTRLIREAANNWFIQSLIKIAENQNGGFVMNKNPRCLLSIEIEFSGSSKLIMGDFTNASMMGHVGLVIGPSKGDIMNRILCVQQYVDTLRQLEKADPSLFMNVACIDEITFWDILKTFSKRV